MPGPGPALHSWTRGIDPGTVAWLDKHCDPVFGYPDIIRFSWSTCEKILQQRARCVTWLGAHEGGAHVLIVGDTRIRRKVPSADTHKGAPKRTLDSHVKLTPAVPALPDSVYQRFKLESKPSYF